MPIQKPIRRRRRAPQAPGPQEQAPQVVYTRPRPFQRRKLLLQLATVFAIVLAVFLGISVFFRVDTVMVSGAEKYSADRVWDASGIQTGDSLLFLGRAGISSRIRQALPYVDTVRFGVKLPGTVMIIIQEFPVVYAIKDSVGSWWLMASNGKIVEKTDSAQANNCTRILGVVLDDPQPGEQAVAWQTSMEPDATGPVTVLDSDRLNAALQIARELERNEMLGEVSTMDVTDPYDLELWYSTRMQVKLGDLQRIDYKLAVLKSAVIELGESCTGVLDVSLTNNPDHIIHQPFEN